MKAANFVYPLGWSSTNTRLDNIFKGTGEILTSLDESGSSVLTSVASEEKRLDFRREELLWVL